MCDCLNFLEEQKPTFYSHGTRLSKGVCPGWTPGTRQVSVTQHTLYLQLEASAEAGPEDELVWEETLGNARSGAGQCCAESSYCWVAGAQACWGHWGTV